MIHAICDFCGKDCDRTATLISMTPFQNFARYHSDSEPYGSRAKTRSFVICRDCCKKHNLPNPYETYSGFKGGMSMLEKLKEIKNKWENELSSVYGSELGIDFIEGGYYVRAFHDEPKGEYWFRTIKEFDCLGNDKSIEIMCRQLGIPVCR